MARKTNPLNLNTLSIIILIIIALILVGSLLNDESSSSSEVAAIDAKRQQYIAKETRTLTYDLNGTITYALTAKEIESFPDSEESFINAPELIVFNKEALAEWKITANSATIFQNRHLTLQENVVVNGLLEDGILKSIQTPQAVIDLNTQDIYTDKKVTVFGQGFRSEGTGLKGNIKNQVATLLNDVISIYEPKIIKNIQ